MLLSGDMESCCGFRIKKIRLGKAHPCQLPRTVKFWTILQEQIAWAHSMRLDRLLMGLASAGFSHQVLQIRAQRIKCSSTFSQARSEREKIMARCTWSFFAKRDSLRHSGSVSNEVVSVGFRSLNSSNRSSYLINVVYLAAFRYGGVCWKPLATVA